MEKIIRFFAQNKTYFAFLIGLTAFSFAIGNLSKPLITVKVKAAQVTPNQEKTPDLVLLQEEVIPEKGYSFKIKWGDLGQKLIQDGVVDSTKLAQALTGKNNLSKEFLAYFENSNQDTIILNDQTAHFWVDVLWALGLANKNPILEEGPIITAGKTANFASTGGYTLGRKQAMEYYSKFSYIKLSDTQQKLVKEISDNIYRPCCGNPTSFPDCNHGMAALGLIELMVSQGFSKEEIFKTVLAFNSYWFPQTYLDIAYHFAKNNRDYKSIPAEEILSKTFSSGQGYAVIRKEVGDLNWPALKSGGGCGA